MGKIIFNIVSIILVILVVCTLWPYVNRFLINYDVKKAATYGTKHSVTETRSLLTEALEKKGVSYDPDKLIISKDAQDTVTIRLRYEDRINFFSLVLKKLQFELYVKKKNVKEYF